MELGNLGKSKSRRVAVLRHGLNFVVLPTITNKQRVFEILAVVATGLGKFIFMDFLQWRFPFIVTAITGWVVYVIYQQRKQPGILQYWGFRGDNFWIVVKILLPFAIGAVIMCVAAGYLINSIIISWHIIPILILYPIWGIIQQFLVISLVAGNLKDMSELRWSNTLIIFITAILFGLLHYPFYWLILGTFILALLYGYVYLKQRNVYAMGLFHGWLGALFFYTVVGRDVYAEVFLSLANGG